MRRGKAGPSVALAKGMTRIPPFLMGFCVFCAPALGFAEGGGNAPRSNSAPVDGLLFGLLAATWVAAGLLARRSDRTRRTADSVLDGSHG